MRSRHYPPYPPVDVRANRRREFLQLKERLSRVGMDISEQAEFLGVQRQTYYQYGFELHKAGARTLTAAALKKLRAETEKREAELLESLLKEKVDRDAA